MSDSYESWLADVGLGDALNDFVIHTGEEGLEEKLPEPSPGNDSDELDDEVDGEVYDTETLDNADIVGSLMVGGADEVEPLDVAGFVADLEPTAVRPPISTVENSQLRARDMLSFIDASVKENGLVGHNLQSFNDLMNSGINQIMTKLFDINRPVANQRTQSEADRKRKSFIIRSQFHDVKVGLPTCTTYLTGQFADLYPNQALLRGLPYSGAVTLGATVIIQAVHEDGHTESRTAEIPPFQIGGFPSMVRSERCRTHDCTREALKAMGEDPTDPGGYFIAKRSEWTVDLLEQIRYNSLHIHKAMKPNELVRAEFLSQPNGAFENSSQIRLRLMTSGQITIEINSMKFEKVKLPFYIIYRLFGMTSDRAVTETIVFDTEDKGAVTKHLLEILEKAFQLADQSFEPLKTELNRAELVRLTAERIVKYLTNPSSYTENDEAVRYLNEDLLGSPGKSGGLDKVLLPHMGQTGGARIRKLRFLGLIIRKMLLVHLGVMPPTDRDSYRNKRVHGAGVSLAKAFKTQMNNSVVIPIVQALKRELKNNPWESINEKTLIDTFRSALTTSDLNRAMEQAITSGNKTIVVRRRAATNRVSSQALERKNYLNTLSALRTVVTQNAGNASKQTERADLMRRVHGTYVGFICVAQSADTGETVGMRKQLAITSGVCVAGDAYPLKLRLLRDPAVIALDDVSSNSILRLGYSPIFVNGEWIGVCKDSYELAGRYRKLRREMRVVDQHTTIYNDPLTGEVEFWLDVGRLRRPLLIVDSNIDEYDAAMLARRKWADEHGGFPVEGIIVEDDETKRPAGIYFHGAKKFFSFANTAAADMKVPEEGIVPDAATPDNMSSAADIELARARREMIEAFLRHPTLTAAEALEKAEAAVADDAPSSVISSAEQLAKRFGADGDGKAPPRPEFIQNIRFTPAHARALTEGKLHFHDLVAEGLAEYITPEEQENCLVARSIDELFASKNDVTKQYSHCDIEQTIFGLAALVSPFANHTQPARVTYETNQGRQTGGWYVLNFPFRTDKNRFFQYYNEIPLVYTLSHKYVPPNGTNTIIAYTSYGGNNQEDSAEFNQAAANRGLFDGAFFRFELAELDKNESFCNPDALTTKDLKPNASYEKLVDGAIRPGSIARNGDVLVGRVAKIGRKTAGTTAPGEDRYHFICRSLVYRRTEPAFVEDVLRLRGVDDQSFILVKLRFDRPLRTGDKLSSRSGNKCLTAEHEVLTATRGWIPIGAVTTDDAVATMCDGALAYDYPTEVHEYEIDEDIYEIDAQLISLRTTLNHRMYVKTRTAKDFQFIEAENVFGKRVSYKRNAENTMPTIQDYVCPGDDDEEPDLAIPMNTWLKILGSFISDGWVDKRNLRYTSIAMKKKRKIDFINDAFEGTGIRHWQLNDKHHIDSPQIRRALEPLSVGAIHKRLPEYVWTLGQAQARILLESLIDGDGHRSKTSDMYYTSSIGLANDVQRLCLHAGWSGNIALHCPEGTEAKTQDGRIITASVDSWRVGIIRSKNQPTVNHSHVKTQNTQTERIIPFIGAVYCLTMPSGLFYVRRYGVPVWSGNSIVAKMFQQSDMPFTESGMVPTILINCHSQPSRMTVGQLIESEIGKICSRRGVLYDGTPFLPVDHASIRRELLANGFRYNGRERMYSGLTGEYFDAAIFIGPVLEQRLQKFVLDDEQSVAGSGPTDATTGQPLRGKHVKGGLRIGHMEGDTLDSHGAMINASEKLSTDSDGRVVHICRGCGNYAIFNEYYKIYKCRSRTCGELADIAAVDSSKSAVLFHEELAAGSINVRFALAPRSVEEVQMPPSSD